MNLPETLHHQISRVRQIIANYDTIPATFIMDTNLILKDIKAAETAIATGDTIAMQRCYAKLEEYTDL